MSVWGHVQKEWSSNCISKALFWKNKQLWNVPNPLSLDIRNPFQQIKSESGACKICPLGSQTLPRDSFVIYRWLVVSSSICRAKMVLSAFEFPSAPVVFGHPLSVPRCRWCAPPSRSWSYKIDSWLDDLMTWNYSLVLVQNMYVKYRRCYRVDWNTIQLVAIYSCFIFGMTSSC